MAASVRRMLLLAASVLAAAEELPPKSFELTNANWHMAKSGYWLVKFHAPWCGHCKRMAPAYESVAKHFHALDADLPGSVRVGKVDGTTEGSLQRQFDVQGYPTVLLLHSGRKVAVFNGERSFAAIVAFVRKQTQHAKASPEGAAAEEGTGRRVRGRAAAARRWERLRTHATKLLTEHNPLSVGLVAFALASSCAIGLLLMICLTTPRPTPPP